MQNLENIMDLSDTILLVNERVRAVSPYHLEPEATSIKLNQNENPYDLPADIKDDIADSLPEEGLLIVTRTSFRTN